MMSLATAQAWIESNFSRLGTEQIPLASAVGRVLARPLAPLTATGRVSAIDGFAVRAAATEGASDYAPLPIETVPIVAGAILPAGTDAVLPAHWLEPSGALAAVAVGENVAPPDPLALAPGLLRPPHIAALARRGETTLEVVRRPTVLVHIAGPKSGPDAIGPMLRALLASLGAQPGQRSPDLVLHAGRSGFGADDDGALAFDAIASRGIRINPGETTTIGTIGGVPAVLLPGDPLACLIAFTLLAAPALHRLAGRSAPAPVQAKLDRKIVSTLGQVDAVRVRLHDGIATPAAPSLAAEADGLVLVPEGSEGYPAGAIIAISPLP